jgi:Protein of unknown function (DUF3047)
MPAAVRRRLLLGSAVGLALPGVGGCALPDAERWPAVRMGSGPSPFSTAKLVDGLPEGWEPHVVRRDRRPTEYRCVQMQGRQVLEASARGSTSGLRSDVDIDPSSRPWIQWDWRTDAFPGDADIADDDRDDSPARLVLSFDGDMRRLSQRDRAFFELVKLITGHALPYATLMYAWDGKSAVEAVVPYPRTARIQYLVVETGATRQGQWLRYRRNVRDDFRRVFGEEPGRIRHVGVLADSDDLQLDLRSWFGDISFEAG